MRHNVEREGPVRTTLLAVTFVAATLMGCKKTDEGEYEVERPVVKTVKDTIIVDKPVVGTEKDTIHTPSVDVGTTEDTVVVKRPTVEVKKPGDSTP
jgi:hypothetical protein